MAISLGSVHLSLLLTNVTTSSKANENRVARTHSHENDDRIYLKLWRNRMRTMCSDALNKKHNNINLAPTLLLGCSFRIRTMRKMNETKLREPNRVCECNLQVVDRNLSTLTSFAQREIRHRLVVYFLQRIFWCYAIIIFSRLVCSVGSCSLDPITSN